MTAENKTTYLAAESVENHIHRDSALLLGRDATTVKRVITSPNSVK